MTTTPPTVQAPLGAGGVQPKNPVTSQAEWLAFLDSVEGAWVGREMDEPDDPPLRAEEPIF